MTSRNNNTDFQEMKEFSEKRRAEIRKEKIQNHLNSQRKIISDKTGKEVCKNSEYEGYPFLGLKINNNNINEDETINEGNENEKLSDYINIYKYYIFSDNKKNKIIKISIDEIDSIHSEKYENNELCYDCSEKVNEIFCIDCQKYLCNKCLNNKHTKHKLYDSSKNDFQINLNELIDKFNKSKNSFKINLSKIEDKINEYKKYLSYLENLYLQYKDINEKLIKFSETIINNYTSNLNYSNKDYKSYFNVKNVLNYNDNLLEFKNKEYSIKEFHYILKEILKSGYHYILFDSKFSNNLDKLNAEKIDDAIIYDLINCQIIDTNYTKLYDINNNRIIGYNELSLEIFNFITGQKELVLRNNKDRNKFITLVVYDEIIAILYLLELYIYSQDLKLKQKLQFGRDNLKADISFISKNEFVVVNENENNFYLIKYRKDNIKHCFVLDYKFELETNNYFSFNDLIIISKDDFLFSSKYHDNGIIRFNYVSNKELEEEDLACFINPFILQKINDFKYILLYSIQDKRNAKDLCQFIQSKNTNCK